MERHKDVTHFKIVSLASALFLSGCAKPPVTGDIVIGRAFQPTTGIYEKQLQWEKENPEKRQNSYIQKALGAGIPRQAIRDGRVAHVGCSNMGNFGQAQERYYLLLPKGVSTDKSPVVVFEAVSADWNRETLSYFYPLSRFIRLSDLGYSDVPRGCFWYHNGKLVEGYDDSYGWAERRAEGQRPPELLDDFRVD